LPMQLIIGTYKAFAVTLVIWLICLFGLYKWWYKNLPPARDGVENPGMIDSRFPWQKENEIAESTDEVSQSLKT